MTRAGRIAFARASTRSGSARSRSGAACSCSSWFPTGRDSPRRSGTAAIPVESSRQSTNSWGLRGPEPDLDAPVRGIVLGDSFMQGMFIGDDDTPPECLRRDLESRLKTKVSILNTGHLGYSPEQYYYSLVEYGDRFVLISSS